MNLKELKKGFEGLDYPSELKLDDSTVIVDVDKFIKSHISVLESNKGNLRFIPYFNRLLSCYKILKENGK